MLAAVRLAKITGPEDGIVARRRGRRVTFVGDPRLIDAVMNGLRRAGATCERANEA